VKIGLFGARADERGLGRLTSEFFAHMAPERTLVVDMAAHARGFTQHLDRYPGATVVRFNGGRFDTGVMERFFAGLDVAVMYETAYDHRAYTIARAAGCRTVLMAMPEFHRHLTERRLPAPDAVWVPTPWLLERFPAGTPVVPVPVERCEPAGGSRGDGEPLRILHVAGHRTTGDRNGTLILLAALAQVREPVSVRIVSQEPHLPRPPRTAPGVEVDMALHGVDDHRRLYDGADVLVMPRRYGGLCLPVQEALGAGLGVVMTDCEPNRIWPIASVPSRRGAVVRAPGGIVPTWDVDPADLARVIDRLASDPGEVATLRARSREWADRHTWDRLEARYRSELALIERCVSPVSTGRVRGRG
jgi:glycosyltransferase involved in cell wall biosynthesis